MKRTLECLDYLPSAPVRYDECAEEFQAPWKVTPWYLRLFGRPLFRRAVSPTGWMADLGEFEYSPWPLVER